MDGKPHLGNRVVSLVLIFIFSVVEMLSYLQEMAFDSAQADFKKPFDTISIAS